MKKSKALKQFTYISDLAQELLKKIPDEIEIDTNRKFKFVTLAELGLKDGVTTKEFLNNEFLAKKGLALCNQEDVFEIAKEVKDYAYMGMNPLTDRFGYPGVFFLDSGGAGLGLAGYDAGSDDGWYSDDRFVFLASTQNFDTQTLPSEPLTLERAIGICVINGYEVKKIIS